MSKLIFGCGYLGARVAARWRAAGEDVFVVTRTSDHARRFTQLGYRPLVADVLRRPSLAGLPTADTVVYAVGFDRGAGVSIHDVFVSGLRNALDALPTATGKLIFISSTGVYGQSQGETVDEGSPCEPVRGGGRACLEAEQALAAHPLGSRAIVLRLAGLYGPGRIPHAAEIRRGQPIATPQSGCLNLIHVDDAANAVLAAVELAAPPRTFVVSDGHPVERRTYFEELAKLLAVPQPTFTEPPPDSPAADRASSDKRVSNERMLKELGVRLEYPSYREGLAAIVAEESGQGAAGTPAGSG